MFFLCSTFFFRTDIKIIHSILDKFLLANNECQQYFENESKNEPDWLITKSINLIRSSDFSAVLAYNSNKKKTENIYSKILNALIHVLFICSGNIISRTYASKNACTWNVSVLHFLPGNVIKYGQHFQEP